MVRRGLAGSTLAAALSVIVAFSALLVPDALAHAEAAALLQAQAEQAAPPKPSDVKKETTSDEETPAPVLTQTERPAAAPVASERPAQASDMALGAVIALLAVVCVIVILRRELWKPSRHHAWPADPPETTVPDWPILGLAALVIWFAQQMGAASARMLLNMPADVLASLKGIGLLSLGGYVGAAIGAMFVLGALPGMTSRIGVSELKRTLPRDVKAGAIAFSLVFPIVLAVGWIATRIASMVEGRSPDPMAHETLKQIADPSAVIGPGALWWWVTVIGVTVGAPLAEELVYRGLLQTSLKRMLVGPSSPRPDLRLLEGSPAAPRWQPSMPLRWLPVLLVATIFTMMHAMVVSPHALATLFVLALGFGIAYERTGRLVVPIVMHILFNAANVVLAFAMP